MTDAPLPARRPCDLRICPAEGPHSHLPLLPATVAEARAEDPAFAEVLGRARATALQTEYRPEVHYPWRPAGLSHDRVNPAHAARVEALIDDWSARAPRPNPYLRAVR